MILKVKKMLVAWIASEQMEQVNKAGRALRKRNKVYSKLKVNQEDRGGTSSTEIDVESQKMLFIFRYIELEWWRESLYTWINISGI